MTPKYIAWLILGMGGPEDLSRGLGAPRLALCEGCRIGSRCSGIEMSNWSPWDWIAYACLGIASVGLALGSLGKESPNLFSEFPSFFSSPKWASVPALLFMLATLIFIVRLVGISAPAQQNNFLDKPANVETITSRTFTNERVTIDGREFYNCVC